jgi:prepilin-type N-terminal cleavage/methylation domain-containing protein/prepilin-type processing-associated H-X9-DG protein
VLLASSAQFAQEAIMSKRPAPQGFTLVEMLVVLTIILVLITMLMPAWHLVRHQANVEICQNNMKQLGTCIFQYVAENNDCIPPGRVEYTQWGASNGTWDARMWYDVILRYGPGGSVTSINSGPNATENYPNTPFAKVSLINGCPEFRYYWWGGCSSATGYAVNFMPYMPAVHQWPEDYTGNPAFPGGDGPGDTHSWNWPPDHDTFCKIDGVTYQGQRGLLGEVTGWAGFPHPPNNGNNQLPGPNDQNGYYSPYRRQTGAFDGDWGDTDFFRHTINGGYQLNSQGLPVDVNRAGCNVLFFDGHIEEVTPWDAWWCTMDPRKFGQKWWHNP